MKKIFTNGCFDILHRGHCELLKCCKSLGHVTVGLNSDESIRRLKGNSRPIHNQIDRAFILNSLEYVDLVCIFDEDTPYELITQVKPDIIVKGGDYCPRDVAGNDLAEVVIFNYVEGYSTTDIIDKVANG